MYVLKGFFSIYSVQRYGQRLSQMSCQIVSNEHDMLQGGLYLAALTLSTSLCAQVLLVMGTFVNAPDNNYCQCQIPQHEH